MRFISKGNTAEIYEYDDRLICKLFDSGYPKMYIEHEFENAKAVCQLGIRTPKAYHLICIDGRYGIVYDKVVGEVLSSKIYCENEEERIGWIYRLAAFHKEILKHHIDKVMNYKDFLNLFASNSVEIITKINELEDGNCLLHGDFHPANVMVDREKQLVLIDMMNVCKGPAIYDVARTYFLLGFDRRLQNRYLELMGYELKDILPYVEVISLLRESERKK